MTSSDVTTAAVTLPVLEAVSAPVRDRAGTALVVPVFRGGITGPGADAALRDMGLDEVPRSAAFRARPGELQVLAAAGDGPDVVAFAGLGRMDELQPSRLREVGGAVTRALGDRTRHLTTTLALTDPAADFLRALAEGLLLGAHRDRRRRSTGTEPRLESISVVVPSGLMDTAPAVFERARVHVLAQLAAARLVTMPAGDLGPQDVVDWAHDNLPDSLDIEVWDEDRLASERCGGLIAVGKGSARPPRLLIVRHEPDNPIASVALVGKGIIFDSGGLSLKSPDGMMTMKDDMGGAAAVLGVMTALESLAPRIAVTGYCALAENMPSGSAQRPGDIFTARNGKTVQVLNTDAEGRLVLADALSVAAEQEPDAIVDIATLTGAVTHAVGRRATGVFGNDDDLLRQMLGAAESAGESTWHLPLWDDLRGDLESDIADLDNIARENRAGATIAALFLQEFVDDVPWLHLDVAGSAWRDTASMHLPSHGTGVPVRTLLRWLEASAG